MPYLNQSVDNFVAQLIYGLHRTGPGVTVFYVQSQAIRHDFIKHLKLIHMNDSVLNFGQIQL